MSAPLPRPVSPRFHKLGPNELLIGTAISQVYPRVYHWIPPSQLRAEGIDSDKGRSRRCGGFGTCIDCEDGLPYFQTFVIGLESNGQRMLLELRERNRAFLELLHNSDSGGVGARVRITRMGSSDNSPIDCVFVEWREGIREWDLTALVESMSLPARSEAGRPVLEVA